jgi:hypothetical protein
MATLSFCHDEVLMQDKPPDGFCNSAEPCCGLTD